MAKKSKEFIDIDGFQCEIKDPQKKTTVLHYQHYLTLEIDRYIADSIMTERKRAYSDGLMSNVKLAPFVLGWLKSPGDNEKLVIAGVITMTEFKKRKKDEESKKNKETKKTIPKTKPSVE